MEQNTNQPNEQQPQQPIAEDEMKMPEEQFGARSDAPQSSSPLVPILVALLIVLLVALGALVVWGDEIMGVLMPAEPAPAEEAATSTDASATDDASSDTAGTYGDIEAELEATDLSELDAELEAIEAELESDATATSSAE